MKRIVIVGGGVAGKTLSSALEENRNLEVILVEPKEYLEAPFAQLRALVEPKTFSPLIRRKFSQLIPQVKHIKKKAIGIKEKKLLLEDGLALDFDFLVISTGSKFPNWAYLKSSEINMKARQKEVVYEANKLKNANSIIIIGGGSVGVELAGEIAYHWNDKRITLVNAGSRILGGLDEKTSRHAVKLLEAIGVKILNNTILTEKEGKWVDAKGNLFESDLVYQAIGMSIDSDWINEDSGITKTEKGFIKVDNTFRVIGRNDVFAIGDIADIPEIKLGAFALKHAALMEKNINSLIINPDAKLKTYKPRKTISMIPIGKKKGAVQLVFGHPHFLIAIKQKDLFASKIL